MPIAPGETEKIVSVFATPFSGDFFHRTRQYESKTANGETRKMGNRILAHGARMVMTSALALIIGGGAALAQQTDIVIGMQLEPPNLDPTAGAAAAIDEVVYANIFEGLTRFAPDGSVVPGLAQSWEVSEDGLTYTFNLHEGVTFHDGSAMTAEDVVFSLDRARAEDSTNAQKPLFAGIESVEAVDDTTVVVTLTAPDGAFPFKMAWGDAVIVDPASAETNATNPVGTGPFRFSEWVQGDRVEIVRNEDYWGEPVALEAATFRFISDPNAAFAAMMSGDLDAFPNFPSPETLAQFEANPQFNVVVGSTEGETILAMNNAGEPLNDPLIRQAISHAINRQDIIDGAMFGYGTPIGTHFAPHNPDYVDLTGNSAYDPDAARALLAEAGVEDLTLRLMLPPPVYARRGGEIIAAQLREVGIETEITNMEWADWLERVFRGHDFDLTIVSHTEPFDINIYANPEYYFQYDNPDFQALNAALEVESDPAERSALLAQMQTMISEQYVNGYLFQLAKTGVANAAIEGLWENSPTQATDLTGVRWTQ
jgi:peptide/nickel transport system substrate-binding protein